jgi:hypothetical protein
LIEFAFVAPILVMLLLNLFDFSALIWATMQTDYAAQMGAQAALKTCAGGPLPAISNCSGLNTAIANAIQRSQSGERLSLRDLLLRVRNGSAIRWHVFLAAEPVRLLDSRKLCCRAWRLRHGAGELLVYADLYRFKPCIEPDSDEHRARKASID